MKYLDQWAACKFQPEASFYRLQSRSIDCSISASLYPSVAEAHEEYLHSLLRKTLLEDPEKISPGNSKSTPLPSVQLELRSLVQQTLELRPRIRSLADTVDTLHSVTAIREYGSIWHPTSNSLFHALHTEVEICESEHAYLRSTFCKTMPDDQILY